MTFVSNIMIILSKLFSGVPCNWCVSLLYPGSKAYCTARMHSNYAVAGVIEGGVTLVVCLVAARIIITNMPTNQYFIMENM